MEDDSYIQKTDEEIWEELDMEWEAHTKEERRAILRTRLKECKELIRRNHLEEEYNMGEYIDDTFIM